MRLGLERAQSLLQIHARRRFRWCFMMDYGSAYRIDRQARLAAWTDHFNR
jgi:hypothetical protein